VEEGAYESDTHSLAIVPLSRANRRTA